MTEGVVSRAIKRGGSDGDLRARAVGFAIGIVSSSHEERRGLRR